LILLASFVVTVDSTIRESTWSSRRSLRESMKPLRGDYYLHQDRIYRVVLASKGTDEIVLEDIQDNSRWEVRYAVFKYAYERVWKVGDVSKFLGRSPRSIYRYESAGLIDNPKRYNGKGDRQIRFYTKKDVLDIHSMISAIHQGRPRKDGKVVNNSLVDRASLVIMFRERYGL
jgi:hypothetical protein